MNLILKKLIKLTNLPYVLKMQQKKRLKIDVNIQLWVDSSKQPGAKNG